MRVLVTGSAGHLGEALVRRLTAAGHTAVGIDVLSSPHTAIVGSIVDRDRVEQAIDGVDHVIHTATLHKPHVDTHSRQAFVDVNVTGTLRLLEAAVAARVQSFVFTSTTSTFGRALSPPPGAPAAWITEAVAPVPKNIYGVTKTAAEDLCELFHRDHGLPCVVLRTSRFFPEDDDDPGKRAAFGRENLQANEFLHRRVELGDAVDAHLIAIERAASVGFAEYIVSATTPFEPSDAPLLAVDAPAVIRRRFPDVLDIYGARGWKLPPTLDRVYDNARARTELGWRPRFDFRHVLDRVQRGEDVLGPLAAVVGAKGYHRERGA